MSKLSVSKFESMLKSNCNYFFDAIEFEEIVQYYIDTGKYFLANKALSLGLDQHPGATELKFLKVELCLLDLDTLNANLILDEIELVEPYNSEVFIQRAMILSHSKNHHQAVVLLRKALIYTDDQHDVWALMAMEYMYLNEFANAKEYFINCINYDVEDYSSLYNLIYCLECLKQYPQAIAFLDSYISKNPYSEIAWHQLGLQYFLLEDYVQAIDAFDYAIAIDESFIGAYFEKARALEALGNYQEAVENYVVTLKLDDASASTYKRIAVCSEKLYEYETAIQYYELAVHQDPMLIKAWVKLINLSMYVNDYNKAIRYVDNALQIDDSSEIFQDLKKKIQQKIDCL